MINAALNRVRTVFLLFTLVVVAGAYAFNTIPRESEPDITVPWIYVSVGLEGISPQDADRMLVNPIAQEIRGLDGLREYTSVATEGHASIIMEFRTGVDIDQALDDVRRKVDRAKPNLPSGADDPTVNEINLALFPILNVNLFGELDDRILYTIAERLQEDLEALPGVLEAPIIGIREELAEIIVDPAMMASYNLSNEELVDQVRRNNQLVTAGSLDTGAGRFSVKVPGLIETEDDILNLPIRSTQDAVVRFQDIAIGQRTYADATQYSRVNGQPAVTLEITKRVGENIIDTVRDVKAVVEAQQGEWPEGLQVSFTADQSVMVEETLSDLFNSVGLATLLVVIVMLWTLGIRTSILVGISIPASFLCGILLLSIMGHTLNIIVLFSLILCVGILVDGAIVVTEYADRRMSSGVPRLNAFREAATRMAWPVISSTLTTLAVFAPLLFWPGIVGEFMGFMPVTVIVTLGSALVVALIVMPALGSVIGKPAVISQRKANNLIAANQGNVERMTGAAGLYIRALRQMLRVPLLVLASVIFIIASLGYFYAQYGKGVEFFPEIDSDFGSIVVRARGNLSLDERDVLVRQVENHILQMPEVRSVNTRTSAFEMQNQAADTIGVLQLELVSWEHRPTALQVMDQIVRETRHIPGIVVERQALAMGPTAGVDIQLDLVSNDLAALTETTRELTRQLQSDGRYVEVSNNLPLEGLEWRIDIDRQAASRFDADLASVGAAMQMLTTGLTIGTYRPADADEELDIRLRYPFSGRDLDMIDRLTVTAGGQQIPLSNFIERRAQSPEGDLRRTDGNLTYRIEANAAPDYLVADLVDDMSRRFAEMRAAGEIPDSVVPRFRGDQEEQDEAAQFLSLAFMVAIFLMFVILVTQFNSLYQALLIMSAIVFSSAGVLLGLLLTGQPFGIVMVGVAIIALAGIVVNNNIVLIDTYNVIRRQGDSPTNAAIKTAAQRLRPVLLTSITTVLGLLPMALQLNIDLLARTITVGAPASQWWAQLSTAIVGGLTFATILTLVLTPCLLVGGDHMIERLRAFRLRKPVESSASQDA
ncbi:efflux RND transporter permease subunit [Natronospirillum operosum]|uniref:Efflux RND transporter permease subunit n=1 Tax=Natronospirillum operosum TaxID=2759953 RepID=A0A4Z0WL33_9GAMM|nr:efflux RND transporter permease subunit [Natronospirillum operosum]